MVRHRHVGVLAAREESKRAVNQYSIISIGPTVFVESEASSSTRAPMGTDIQQRRNGASGRAQEPASDQPSVK